MSTTPAVFIRYSTADRDVATRLYGDLDAKGARVFQFEKSAIPGQHVYSKVAEAIQASDYFLVLLTEASVESKPAEWEIDLAVYANVNDENNLPSLIPLELEVVQPPAVISGRTLLPFRDYDQGLARLVKLMKLAPEPPRVRPVGPSPLTVTLAAIGPSVASRGRILWTAVAVNRGTQLLSNVVMRLGSSIVKGPVDLPPNERAAVEIPVEYRSPGRKQRRLVVSAELPTGEELRATDVARVEVHGVSQVAEGGRVDSDEPWTPRGWRPVLPPATVQVEATRVFGFLLSKKYRWSVFVALLVLAGAYYWVTMSQDWSAFFEEHSEAVARGEIGIEDWEQPSVWVVLPWFYLTVFLFIGGPSLAWSRVKKRCRASRWSLRTGLLEVDRVMQDFWESRLPAKRRCQRICEERLKRSSLAERLSELVALEKRGDVESARGGYEHWNAKLAELLSDLVHLPLAYSRDEKGDWVRDVYLGVPDQPDASSDSRVDAALADYVDGKLDTVTGRSDGVSWWRGHHSQAISDRGTRRRDGSGRSG